MNILKNSFLSFLASCCFISAIPDKTHTNACCIRSLSHKSPLSFAPLPTFSEQAHIKTELEYQKLYQNSLANPVFFWEECAKDVSWFKPWDSVFGWHDKTRMLFTWFDGGQLNVSYNCLDRHLATAGTKIALIWQGDADNEVRTVTYQQLHDEVCAFTNVLKNKGIQTGDRVCIYLPMIPEAVIAMLACTRIGAVHSVVFGGFSSTALKNRMDDCHCKLLITADGGMRGGKKVPLKAMADEALATYEVPSVIVVQRTGAPITMQHGRDTWWHEEMNQPNIHTTCEPMPMDAQAPLFILYTSGTTGKPKGVVHATGGYLVYVHQTFKYIFDYHPNDIYWCTADIGWITGHSYLVYGPLSNGATILMFEGIPTYPDNNRYWQIIEKFNVSVLYTSPTAIRALAASNSMPAQEHNLSSLRLLGSVGEPINEEPWLWYYHMVGDNKCPIVDTWWQTETGGILIAPLPGATTLKPGSATKPFFGIEPTIINDEGMELGDNQGGYLVIKCPWPGCARTLYGDHDRYIKTYWSPHNGYFLTGDAARRDSDGDFWLMGRVDDVIKVSGHRIGTAEVESALTSHHAVAEAAIVPIPHAIKGEALYAFVVLKNNVTIEPTFIEELRAHVAKEMGPIAKPDKIQICTALPKTRSGKIVRRILKAIAQGSSEYGDTSTLVDASIIEDLVKGRIV